MVALVLMAAVAGGTPVVLTDRATIALPDRAIRLGDVVGPGVELGLAGQRVIARVPAGARRLALSRSDIATLVRRAVPGLSVVGDDRSIIFTASVSRPGKSVVSKVAVRPMPSVARGDTMTLEFRTGPVTIARSVTALQPGYAGRRVFVRDAAGHVFSAPIGEGRTMKRAVLLVAGLALLPIQANADDLYKRNNWSALSTDRRASDVGDLLTVVVYENSESSKTTKSDSRRSTQLGGSIAGGGLNESGNLQFGGGYTGGGGVTRSDKLIAQITVRISAVLPNGDMIVSGQQSMKINGESTLIGIEGRIRPDDIAGDNRILSSRIADAKIIYDGKGFVARSAKPGLVARVFRFLGLG